MRILVQQVETGLFYKTSGQWVDDKLQAHAFATSAEALNVCLHHERGKVQIVFSFSDSRFDMVINLSETNKS